MWISVRGATARATPLPTYVIEEHRATRECEAEEAVEETAHGDRVLAVLVQPALLVKPDAEAAARGGPR